jgi:hypothetical protein
MHSALADGTWHDPVSKFWEWLALIKSLELIKSLDSGGSGNWSERSGPFTLQMAANKELIYVYNLSIVPIEPETNPASLSCLPKVPIIIRSVRPPSNLY